jgi:Na+/H+ antiporter NhaD/arsenite permease-like protein
MNLAVISVCALALAVIVSCVSRLNVGVLALALAWIVGVYIAGMPVNTVMAGFPSQLFLTLTGVTLLFALAQANGTLERLTHHAVHLCRGNCGTIPIMFFLLGAALSSIGPGNIATAALLAPLAMATASRTGIPLFLMAIMVGNGANSGGLSPIAPTGIIVNGLMARNGLPGFELQTYAVNLLAHALVAFGGYFLLGGLRLFGAGSATPAPAEAEASAGPFERRHWITIGVIAALIVSVIVAKVHVGMGAFLGAVVLVLTGSADDGEAVKRMPWRVIVMVCGVTVLIFVLEKTGGMELFTAMLARLATPATLNGTVAFVTGLISSWSSTSGVVLPTFLPTVPGLVQKVGGGDPLAVALSINVGSALVDVSPLSTLGALCVATVADPAEARTLFRQLLLWGLSMSVVGAVLCQLLAGAMARA